MHTFHREIVCVVRFFIKGLNHLELTQGSSFCITRCAFISCNLELLVYLLCESVMLVTSGEGDGVATPSCGIYYI